VVAIDPIRPLLLKWNAEQGHSSNFVSHNFQEVMNVSPFLNVVRQVKVRVVEEIIAC
jgi:hypothetical protein